MRLQTNFSFPLDRLVPFLTVFFGGAAVLALIGALALVGSALGLRKENPDLKMTLEDLRKIPLAAVDPSTLPSAQQEKNLKRHLADLNALQAGRRSPLFHLARLEELLPAEARLLSFQDDVDTGEIQLTVEALSLEDLSRFMAVLEKDGVFTKVTLTKQSQSQGMKGNWIQFSLDMVGNL
jgi:Tfp pilus assembly protein PilN